MKFYLWLCASTLYLSAPLGQAQSVAPAACSARLQISAADLTTISDSMAAVPIVRQYILEILNSEQAPDSVKRILKRALTHPGLEVIKLTEAIAKERSGLTTTFMIRDTSLPAWGYGATDPGNAAPVETSLNAIAQAADIKSAERKAHQIYAPDQPMTKDFNDLIDLVHELAHIRFDLFFQKNYQRMCDRFPITFVQRLADGRCTLSKEMFDFLHERFAYEAEARFYTAMGHKYPAQSFSARGAWETFVEDLGAWLIRDYQYSTPQVVHLGGEPLQKILLGKGRIRVIDQAIRILGGPQYRPDAEQMPIVLNFLDLVIAKEKDDSEHVLYYRRKVVDGIHLLAKSVNGLDRVRHLMASLIYHAGATGNVTMQTRLVAIANKHLRRTLTEIGWSTTEPLTWNDLANEGSKIQILAKSQ